MGRRDLSRMGTVAIFEMAGAVAFTIGSAFFIASSVAGADWLRPYQRGVLIWIPGSVAYLCALAAARLPAGGCPSREVVRRQLCTPGGCRSRQSAQRFAGELCTASCMCTFIAGCSVSLASATEERVLQVLGQVNALFLAGTLCAAVQSLLEIQLVWEERRPWWAGAISCASAASYVVAAVLGGYYPAHVVVGMCFWLVGSLLMTLMPAAALLRAHRQRSSASGRGATSTVEVARRAAPPTPPPPTAAAPVAAGAARAAAPSERHIAAARAAMAALYAGIHSSDSHRLSVAESTRLRLSRSSERLDLTYGDSSFDAVLTGLRVARLAAGGVFIDLGSGSGRCVLTAALLFGLSRSIGIELLPALHEQAAEPLRRFEGLRRQLAASHTPTASDAVAVSASDAALETDAVGAETDGPSGLLCDGADGGATIGGAARGVSDGPGGACRCVCVQGKGAGGGVHAAAGAELAAPPGALDASLLAARVELRQGDLFADDVREALRAADVVYCCCASWEPPTMHRLAVKLAHDLTAGARVLTVGRPLLGRVDVPIEAAGEGAQEEEEEGREGEKAGRCGQQAASSSSSGGSRRSTRAASGDAHVRRVRFVEVWHGLAHLGWGQEPLVLHEVVHGAGPPPLAGEG